MTRKWPTLTVGLILTLALIVGLAWASGRQHPEPRRAITPGDELPAGSGSLLIRDMRVTDPLSPDSKVKASAVAVWSGVEFPGVYNCTFVAKDESGQEVGRYEDTVVSLDPRASFAVQVDAASPARTLDAECGSRLDVGTPYRYELSNINVSDAEPAIVTFDASWAGTGQAGAVSCDVTVLDQSGSVVGSKDMNLFLLNGSGVGLRTTVNADGIPGTARVECSPFSGS